MTNAWGRVITETMIKITIGSEIFIWLLNDA